MSAWIKKNLEELSGLFVSFHFTGEKTLSCLTNKKVTFLNQQQLDWDYDSGPQSSTSVSFVLHQIYWVNPRH